MYIYTVVHIHIVYGWSLIPFAEHHTKLKNIHFFGGFHDQSTFDRVLAAISHSPVTGLSLSLLSMTASEEASGWLSFRRHRHGPRGVDIPRAFAEMAHLLPQLIMLDISPHYGGLCGKHLKVKAAQMIAEVRHPGPFAPNSTYN
jgi:hypothetical protein